MRRNIQADKAPKAIGPYSQAISTGHLLFTAGQIPISPLSGSLITGKIKEQTKQVLENLKAVIEAGGSELALVLKTTVYLTNPEDFPAMNEIYAHYFNTSPPARTTVFVSALPKGALIEIEAVAMVKE